MDELGAEARHYADRTASELDALLDGRITVPMAVVMLSCLFPIMDREGEDSLATRITLMLLDLQETPTERQLVERSLLAMILDAWECRDLTADLEAAIAALKARGLVVTPAAGLNRFQIDGRGDYSIDEIRDEALRM